MSRFHTVSPTPRGSRAVTSRFLSTEALTHRDREMWRRLADRAVEGNPFYGPEYVLAAARGRREHALLLVSETEREWTMCLPVRRAQSWQRLPFPCLGPWLPEYSYLATPLAERNHLEESAAAMAQALASERCAAMLVLAPIDPSGPVGAALTAAFAARGLTPAVYRDFARAAVRRRTEQTYLEESLRGRRRKELRRLRRALEREAGGEVVTVDRSGESGAWHAFLRLERLGWKGDLGTAIGSNEGDAAFFLRMCAGMHARGQLQVLALEAGGETVAMQINLLHGDVTCAFKVAHDPAWSRWSPGVLLEVDGLVLFHDRMTATTLDSCASPHNTLLNRLWPDRRRLQELAVPTGAPLGALVGPAVRSIDGVRRLRRRYETWRAKGPAPPTAR